MKVALPIRCCIVFLRSCCSFTTTITTTRTRATFPNQNYSPRVQCRLAAASPRVHYLETVRAGISDAGFSEAWNEATKILSERANLEVEQAEECLAKAWNWKTWAICTSPIARKYIKPIPPDATAVAASLDWLLVTGPLCLSPEAVRAGLVASPEAYLKAPHTNYERALQVAPRKYRDPSAFKALLLEYPKTLQRTYNCVDGGCNSECGNCWVAFANSPS
jgi:hypothetical protein